MTGIRQGEESMQPIYYAGIQQSGATVKRYSRVRYNIFKTGYKLLTLAAAVGAAAASIWLAVRSEGWALLLMFIACVIFANLDAPADFTANQVIRMFGGNYPTLVYTFFPAYYCVQDNGEKHYYHSVTKLVEDGEYLYLFQNERVGIMIRADSVKGKGNTEDFRSFLSKKTGMAWKKQSALLTVRLSGIFDRLGRSTR